MMDSTLDFPQDDNGHGEGQQERRGNPTLHSEKLRTERKTFFLDLKENFRGRFVKITEDVRGRRDTILVPIEALDDFGDAIERIRDVVDELGDSVETDSEERRDLENDS